MRIVISIFALLLASNLSLAQQEVDIKKLLLKVCSSNNSRPMSMELQPLGFTKEGSLSGNLKFESIDPESKKPVAIESQFIVAGGAEIPVSTFHSGQNIFLQNKFKLKKVNKIDMAILVTQKSKIPFALFEMTDVENKTVFSLSLIERSEAASSDEAVDKESEAKELVFDQLRNPVFSGSVANCK